MATLWSDLKAATIDLDGAEFRERPVEVFESARQVAPVAKCPFGPMALGYDVVRDLAKDRRLRFPGAHLAEMFGITEGAWADWFPKGLVNLEGERHTRQRRLLSPALTPSKADSARPVMRDIFAPMLQRAIAAGKCDFPVDVALEYPIRVFCAVSGVPGEDVPQFVHWSNKMAKVADYKIDEIIDELNDAVTGLSGYVEGLLAARAGSGDRRQDLIQDLLDAEEEGDRLSHQEIVDLWVFMLGGATNTTSNQLCWGAYELATHRDIKERVASEPGAAKRFVDELMRVRAVAGSTGRLATEDVEHDGVLYPAGTHLFLQWSAAGHDPQVYKDPHAFNLDREAGRPLLSFGWGHHYCIGAHLAKAELEEALTLLAREKFVLAAEPQFGTPVGLHWVHSLPIEFC